MKNLFWGLLLALAATPPAAAQSGEPVKIKVKTKGGAAAGQVPTPPSATSPAAAYAATITAAGLRADLTELASDAYEGRETGRPGQEKAAQYLIRQLQALGLRGPVGADAVGGGFRQAFGLVSTVPTGPGVLRLGPASYVGGRDFVRFGASTFGAGETAVAPVFRGYGLATARYDDYAGLPDVRGRDVIVLMGEPTSEAGRSLLTGAKRSAQEQAREDWNSVFRKAALARDRGARSLTLISGIPGAAFAGLGQQLGPALAEPTVGLTAPVPQPTEAAMLEQAPPAGISTLLTSAPLGLALLGGATPESLRRYEAECYRLARPAPAGPTPLPFSVEFPEKREELSSANVLGLLEGTDKKDEVIVVSAHYDHVGVQHDTIYNGADDDGSGTSAVLALARAFAAAKAAGQGPRRSILFLLNSGEEKGLLGSEYYTGHPALPLQNTVADLNIDMVGRTDKAHQGKGRPDYLYLIGSDRLSSQLHILSEATNNLYARLRLDYKYNDPQDPEQLYYRSDHYNFARHRIPVIFYTSGLHPDYHKATDDVDKIEFDRLAERAQLIFYTAWELASRDERVAVDVVAKP